jgi:hypothetical protein
MLFFAAVITVLVEKTSQYCQQYLDVISDAPSPILDVTESEIFLFLAIIILMGHDTHDSLKDCWSTTEHFFSHLYARQ